MDYTASLENAIKCVLAEGLSTGHADSFEELMGEVLWQYRELREKLRSK